MQITKTSDRAAYLKQARRVANDGCDKCPCCGETYRGFFAPPVRAWYERGLFRTGRHVAVDCYTCDACGAEWESDPYEIG